MPTDKKLDNLIFNQLTKAQYEAAKTAGEISNDEFYMITDDADIFWAEYGVTTCAEIIAAHNAGKIVMCELGNHIGQLTYIAGTMTCIFNGSKVVINCIMDEWSTENIYTAMEGATDSGAGAQGFVPRPVAGDNVKYLRGDGTWSEVTSAKGVSATLVASEWEASLEYDGALINTISVSGVTTSNQVIIDCALTSSDKDANIAILQGWGCVNDCK